MNNNGWIKLHRKLIDKGFYKDSHYVHLWIHLLLEANHEARELLWNGKTILIKRGQFITGRLALSRVTRISESKVNRILKYLESEQMIEQQIFSKFRIITIVKYEKYQTNEQQNEQQVNNRRTTDEQQLNTNKNVRIKELKKDIAPPTAAPFSWEKYLEGLENHKRRDLQVIGFFFRKKKIRFDSLLEAQAAVKRHLRAAGEVAKFTDDKIVSAYQVADKEYPSLYTPETLLKIMTR